MSAQIVSIMVAADSPRYLLGFSFLSAFGLLVVWCLYPDFAKP
jgi:hypothetical protein